MIFKEGTRVEFLHTGEKGIIRSVIDTEMVNVELIDDDMEIPVHIEDLITLNFQEKKAEEAKKAKQETQKPKFKVPKAKKNPQAPPPVPKVSAEVKSRKDPAFEEACYLAFEPLFSADGETYGFQLYLINNSAYTLVYEYRFTCGGEEVGRGNSSIQAYSFVPLEKMDYLQLNDAPTFWLNCRPGTTDGKHYWQEKTLKVKAKQFFKKIKQSPLIKRQAHLYLLLDNFFAKANQFDLKSYTKQQKPTPGKKEKSGLQHWFDKVKSPEDVAAFPTQIDLHIEKLHDNPSKLSRGEIISIQLRTFEKYIEDALDHNISPVTIIHGRGKGRLRNEVLIRLRKMPQVSRYEEDFGNGGATRVFL